MPTLNKGELTIRISEEELRYMLASSTGKASSTIADKLAQKWLEENEKAAMQFLSQDDIKERVIGRVVELIAEKSKRLFFEKLVDYAKQKNVLNDI